MPALPPKLHNAIHDAIANLPFALGFAAKHLGNGTTLAHNPDGVFPSASVVKLPLLLTALHQVDTGQLSLTTRIPMQTQDQAGGSGLLKFLDAGLACTLKDLLTLMIVVSDNTATNLCLDAVGGYGVVTQHMQTHGFANTTMVGKLQVDASQHSPLQRQGLRATTSATDCIAMLEKLHHGQLLSQNSTVLALEMLCNQQYTEMLGRLLPDGTQVACKSGQINGTRNDVGLVFAPNGVYAVAFLTSGITDLRYSIENEAVLEIAKLSRLVYDFMYDFMEQA